MCCVHIKLRVLILSVSALLLFQTSSGEQIKPKDAQCAWGSASIVEVSAVEDVLGKRVPGATSELIASSANPRAKSVMVTGPMLGSMDSRRINASITCNAEGVIVTGIITRSKDYKGAASKNVVWQPKILVSLNLEVPHITVQAVWRMKSSNGEEIKRAQTPPYPEVVFPIEERIQISH